MNLNEDFQAWEQYPQHRWVFNKLELALYLGYEAGPACVPIPRRNKYVIRPIYNLYGMGLGATVKELDPEIHSLEMQEHGHIPPGHFWCEFFEGPHYSIDFKRTAQPKGSVFFWEPISAILGKHYDSNYLSTFKSWEVVDLFEVLLPLRLLELTGVEFLNIEMIGDKIIEVHLRSGNDFTWNTTVGTKYYPIWTNEELDSYAKQGYEIIPNHHSDSSKYSASGNLSNVRIGFAKLATAF